MLEKNCCINIYS